MKTHMFTQLFLYCSEGELGVKCVRPALEMKASREVWFVSWWLSVLRRAIKPKCPGMLSDGIILLLDTANLVRDNFRDLVGKHFNILRTVQIVSLVTSTFLAI